MRPPYGEIPCVITHAFELLIGRIVFFINDNEAQLGHGCKYGQPGTDHNLRFAHQRCREMPGTSGLCDLTVQAHHGNIWKALCDPCFQQGGQINFRHEQQYLFTPRQRRLNKP